MHVFASWALLAALVASGGDPTPTPAPVPSVAPVGAPAGDTQVQIAPAPSTAPATVPSMAPAQAVLPHEAGPVQIVVRACRDDNGDRLCGVAEGLTGLPVFVLDADTGDQLVAADTIDGRAVLVFTLASRARLSINAPYLHMAQLASPTERGADLMLDPIVLPELLP